MTAVPTPAADALKGRVILITGAHGGLGEASAKACAAAGANTIGFQANVSIICLRSCGMTKLPGLAFLSIESNNTATTLHRLRHG